MYARYGIQYLAQHLQQEQELRASRRYDGAGEIDQAAPHSHDVRIFVRLACVIAVFSVGAAGVTQLMH
ncbi:hypothetical protein [Rhizobium mayense]|uniref:Uncharacterized protein n=1 Tax=Rhizobium mayense TaxID=1312184 RepID=A0ABT7JNE0_9HYPH|nr:hypothetical protein [Rhizobium mayense]MDL2397858.1 hypothetical protein [Rhizobium mayense]